MGGHHGPEIPKVPDYTIYKVEDVPELMEVQNRLAKKGLKDPWLRNHVWRYQLNKNAPMVNYPLLRYFTIGWKYWIPLVGLTIGIEQFLGIDYHGHSHDDHGHGSEGHH